MTLKLAWRNVRRSARDYGIYFLTLTLAVAMFYAFNSISEQAVLFDGMSQASERMLGLMNYMMGLFSGAIAFVLAFLVVYANRFLLKRRKREFGMYLTLGMGTGQVARILLCEIALVGVASLAVGLVLGLVVAQGMAFVTAALMDTTMSSYQFIISGQAILLTLACFAGIFLLSAMVDVFYVSRRKLADLISQHEGSEAPSLRNPLVSGVVFVSSVVVLGVAYWQLKLNGLIMMDEHFTIATVLMVIGTVGFFWSVSGFLLAFFGKSRTMRFKGLATFTMRQITSKVNTAFASMSVVCVMLFLAITTLSGGLAMVNLFVGNLQEQTRYDATLACGDVTASAKGEDPRQVFKEMWPDSYRNAEAYDYDAVAFLKDNSDCWDEVVRDAGQIDYYLTAATYGDIFSSVPGSADGVEDLLDGQWDAQVKVIPLSQYNKLHALLGEPTIGLEKGQFLINNQLSGLDGAVSKLCQGGATLKVADETLTCAAKSDAFPMRTSAMLDVVMELVVPDSVVGTLKANGAIPSASYLDVMYQSDRASGDEGLSTLLGQAFEVQAESSDILENGASIWPAFNVYTASEMVDQATGLRMVITYLAMYIGFILLLTTATVLAIQQLSEVTDSLPRYRRLWDLGVDARDIFRSLRAQTCAYFFAPLVLAACHSACALWVLNEGFAAELGVDMTGAVAIAAGLLVLIYLVFLAVSYLTSKSMVKQELTSRR